MWYANTIEYYSLMRKWYLVICDNMDGSWGYYAKQSEWDKETGLRFWIVVTKGKEAVGAGEWMVDWVKEIDWMVVSGN